MANYKNDTLINVIIIVIPRLAIKRLLEAKAKEKKVEKKILSKLRPSIQRFHTHTHTQSTSKENPGKLKSSLVIPTTLFSTFNWDGRIDTRGRRRGGRRF